MRAHTAVPAFVAGAVVSVRGVALRARHAIATLSLVGLALAACATNGPTDRSSNDHAGAANEEAAVDTVSIEDALDERRDAWMEIDGVEGTGIGLCDDVPCIKIFVSRPPEELEDVLPESVHGHPIRLEPTGRFEAQ